MKKVEKLANEIRESMQGWQIDLEGHLESINDILNKHAPIEKPFPKYMIIEDELLAPDEHGTVVYFYDTGVGTVHIGSDGFGVGHYSDRWTMQDFKDCEIQVKP